MSFLSFLKIFSSASFWRKLLLATLLFYVLALFQSSFLAPLGLGGIFPNLILVAVLLFNILEPPQKYFGKMAGLIGGFFLDVFSALPLGTGVLTLGLLALMLKRVAPPFKRINLISFLFLFLLGLILYEILLPPLTFLFSFSFGALVSFRSLLDLATWLTFLYNTILGTMGFASYRFLKRR